MTKDYCYMSIRLKILRIQDFVRRWRKALLQYLDGMGLFASILGFLVFIYHIGFIHSQSQIDHIHIAYNVILLLILLSNLAGLVLLTWRDKSWKLRLAEVFMIPLVWVLFDSRTGFSGMDWSSSRYFGYITHDLAVQLVIVFVLLVEISTSSLKLSNRNSNPALLFAGSFLFLVLFGTGLLMLPNATVSGIAFTDAFFTATSAVCVTGLIVVDTATYFTPLGQTIILLLIQLGGLGIMTFTSFFGYFFKGGSSFGNEFLLKEMLNEDKLGEIFRTLMKIIFLTFFIEIAGALLIYSTMDLRLFDNRMQMAAFSVFHSVSAYCNAGFSLLTNNLFETGYNKNFNFHWVVAWLVIAGGLGFPIIFNYFRLLRYWIVNRAKQWIFSKPYVYLPRIINANSRIVLITTLILIVFGWIMFFVLEYHNSLSDLSLYGKISAAFFASVTPRTAGFNTIDMGLMTQATILLYLFLMWIGASPASTGGGIKTTTFAVAVMNVAALARGKDRVEMKGREISQISSRRAFAVILLSLAVIGVAVFILSLTDAELGLKNIIFETVSAYSTVGLSLGITAKLSTAGKWIIIFTMFLGRVGTLTLLVGILRRARFLQYKYPSEHIMIN